MSSPPHLFEKLYSKRKSVIPFDIAHSILVLCDGSFKGTNNSKSRQPIKHLMYSFGLPSLKMNRLLGKSGSRVERVNKNSNLMDSTLSESAPSASNFLGVLKHSGRMC
jgi:hypothetical protein